MFFVTSKTIVLIVVILCEKFSNTYADFNLHLVHFNDFHARFEETAVNELPTKNNNCIGGFSRLYTAINRELKRNPNSIVLNAGDNFQGTYWYTLLRWNVTQYFLNKIQIDANALGNHEFDEELEGVIPFMKALRAPTVVANIDDSQEPKFQNTYKKSIIINRENKRIGIIGVLVATTPQISRTGKLNFTDELESVKSEAKRLVSKENVDTIIVLSHCGYNVDLKIAKLALPKIGIIVGGHTHSFLFTGNNPPGIDKPVGPYPTVVKNKNGNKVLVVQASAHTKYLGNITVGYDDEGQVVSWSGAPIYLDEKIPEDETINKEIAIWKKTIDNVGKEIIGETRVTLNNEYCKSQECSLGNLLADSMIYAWRNRTEPNGSPYASIAIINSGAMRKSLKIGNITYRDLLNLYPFETTADVGELQGKYLLEALEFAAQESKFNITYRDLLNLYPLETTADVGELQEKYLLKALEFADQESKFNITYRDLLFGTKEFTSRQNVMKLNFLQLSGIRVVYNTTKPAGSRVKSVQVSCRLCSTPKYEDLDLNKMYRIIVNSFIASSGDGFQVVFDNIINYQTGPRDIDNFVKYIRYLSPINDLTNGRIKVVT